MEEVADKSTPFSNEFRTELAVAVASASAVQDLNNSMSSLPAAMAVLTAVKVWASVSVVATCCNDV